MPRIDRDPVRSLNQALFQRVRGNTLAEIVLLVNDAFGGQKRHGKSTADDPQAQGWIRLNIPLPRGEEPAKDTRWDIGYVSGVEYELPPGENIPQLRVCRLDVPQADFEPNADWPESSGVLFYSPKAERLALDLWLGLREEAAAFIRSHYQPTGPVANALGWMKDKIIDPSKGTHTDVRILLKWVDPQNQTQSIEVPVPEDKRFNEALAVLVRDVVHDLDAGGVDSRSNKDAFDESSSETGLNPRSLLKSGQKLLARMSATTPPAPPISAPPSLKNDPLANLTYTEHMQVPKGRPNAKWILAVEASARAQGILRVQLSLPFHGNLGKELRAASKWEEYGFSVKPRTLTCGDFYLEKNLPLEGG